MKFLSNKSDSIQLQKAWDLDQQALFDTNKKTQKKLWIQSVLICKELLKKHKSPTMDRFQILSKLASIYQHQGKFSLAKRCLDDIHKKKKNDAIVMFNYGNLYRAMGQSKRAIGYYKKAVLFGEGNKIFTKELERYESILKRDSK